jgi:addiction module HigA family antidote
MSACIRLGLNGTDGAMVLRVPRHTLSRVLNGQAGISAEMAIRLEKAGWSNADHWLRLQAAYDLAQARQHQDEIKVRRYEHQLPA